MAIGDYTGAQQLMTMGHDGGVAVGQICILVGGLMVACHGYGPAIGVVTAVLNKSACTVCLDGICEIEVKCALTPGHFLELQGSDVRATDKVTNVVYLGRGYVKIG